VKEDLLHYIWKYKLFAVEQLKTTQKETIQLINAGDHNHNTGPDFFNAQLKIDNQLWAGNVEIHVKSSDWYVHGHEKDSNYDTVILHVVWEDDVEIFRKDNSLIPTLELKNYVNEEILTNYRKLFSTPQKWINCENDIASIDEFLLNNWLERLYIERLEQKSDLIQQLLDDSKNDWEAVLFKMLSKNFGLKVNGDAFLNVANSIDFSILRKEKHTLLNIEALLFGQAVLLNDDIQDGYYQHLQKEYGYLQKKYQLQLNNKSQIQFFRLRPNNFPTIRLAQLATLLHYNQNMFSKVMETTQLKDFYELFDISVSEYWQTHYSFTSTSKKYNKKLTKPFVDLLLINTIIPLQFMYLKHINKLNVERLLNIVRQIKTEKNTIINKYKLLNVASNNALESQALLQLKNEYCTKQKCLQCAIGKFLIINK
jgi:hypothetical protein